MWKIVNDDIVGEYKAKEIGKEEVREDTSVYVIVLKRKALLRDYSLSRPRKVTTFQQGFPALPRLLSVDAEPRACLQNALFSFAQITSNTYSLSLSLSLSLSMCVCVFYSILQGYRHAI